MNKYLKVPTHNPNVCIRILQLNTANPFRRSVMAGPSLLQPPPCRGGVISVHHDPVHGIVTNPGNREWGQSPLSFFVVCDNPVHRVLVNWEPPISQVVDLPGTIQNCITSIGVSFLDCTSTRQVYNLGNGGVPVHHDPVDGIWTNHEK